MMQEKNYKIISETQELVLGHLYEEAFLTLKKSNETIGLGEFYGEPKCGLISHTNDWCIAGGSTLVVWTKNEIFRIKDDDLHWVFDIRQVGLYKVELLIDPWGNNSSVWEFDIMTRVKNKIKDFPGYKDKEYTDHVLW